MKSKEAYTEEKIVNQIKATRKFATAKNIQLLARMTDGLDGELQNGIERVLGITAGALYKLDLINKSWLHS